MKFCYIDESGMGQEPYLVMAGVIVDATRMHVTKEIWADFLQALSGAARREITEFHTKDFYRGNGPWRKLDGPVRTRIIVAILKWLTDRKHHITWCVIDIEAWKDQAGKDPRLQDLETPWRTAAFHMVLTLQKRFQTESRNKGHTVCVFDREVKEEAKLAKLICAPPDWSDSYYERARRQSPLDQIVDVPHFVDSEDVVLIQVADLIAYLLRNYVELVTGHAKERYAGEAKQINEWVNTIAQRSLPPVNRYAKRNRCETAELFWGLAPDCMRM